MRKILTVRNIQDWPSWDLVYEWEDVLSKELKIPLLLENTKFTNKYVRKITGIYALRRIGCKIFAFEMGPEISPGFRNSRNYKSYYPCIIDFFLTKNEIVAFEKQYENNRVVFISSKEAYDFLKKEKCRLNICHLPLSISDKYKISSETYFEKKYDLVLMGRQNPVLSRYLTMYSQKHPDLYIAYRKMENNKFYYFTNRGEKLGDINTRAQYMQLLRLGKASLYSTPGMDDESGRTRGYNQVTPRFLEMLACGVNPVMRYADNSDTRYFALSSFGSSINTYDEFVEALENAVKNPADMKKNALYLEKHYTSCIAEKLNEIMK